MFRRFRWPVVCAALALLGTPDPARAAPIIYTFSGTASGTVGTTPFTNAAFAVTLFGDTAGVRQVAPFGGPPVWQNAPLAQSRITIAGFGTGTVTTLLGVFDNPTVDAVGFGTYVAAFGGLVLDVIDLDLVGVGLNTYDLRSTFGPVTDTTPIVQVSTLRTTLGNVRFTSVSSATFEAQVVPEPGGLAVFGLGALGLAGGRRSRRGRA